MLTVKTKVQTSIIHLTTETVSLPEEEWQMVYHAQPRNSQPALCGPPGYCFLLSLISISIPTPTIPWALATTLPLSPHSYVVASLPQHCGCSHSALSLLAQAELQVQEDVSQQHVVRRIRQGTAVLLGFLQVLSSLMHLSYQKVLFQHVMV